MIMVNIPTAFPDLKLMAPNPDRDALFAFTWFDSVSGKDTLLRMGNAESEISEPSLEREKEILRDFIQLEASGKQITRMIVYKDITIGAVWIEQEDTQHVNAPGLHIMIGDPLYRGMGIGTAIMKTMIGYAYDELYATTVYSRHLASNDIISRVFERLGFERDGELYTEKNGLTFQNVKREKLSELKGPKENLGSQV